MVMNNADYDEVILDQMIGDCKQTLATYASRVNEYSTRNVGVLMSILVKQDKRIKELERQVQAIRLKLDILGFIEVRNAIEIIGNIYENPEILEGTNDTDTTATKD